MLWPDSIGATLIAINKYHKPKNMKKARILVEILKTFLTAPVILFKSNWAGMDQDV